MQNSKQSERSGGVGIGSASIVLIFASLCLMTFSLIAYIVASNNKSITDAETRLVTGFYHADTLAERIMLEIETSGTVPGVYNAGNFDVQITALYDEQFQADIFSFYCPVFTSRQGDEVSKALYVSFIENGSCYDILSWRMVDTDQWQADGGVNVWDGN